MADELRYSRPRGAAKNLGAKAPDRHRFQEKSVLLTGEERILATDNGRRCLLDSLRLLPRICRHVTLQLPAAATSLASEASALVQRLGFDVAVQLTSRLSLTDRPDAILSVGTAARVDLPWTVINANGWVARVSSGQTSLPPDCSRSNPIAALAAASLGVAEVFKRLLDVDPNRAPLLDGVGWSLMSYQVSAGDPGPPIPDLALPPTVLVGAGAIGNGIVHLLGQLPLRGRLYLVDGQAYGEENLGTCILIGPEQVGQMKAAFAAECLGSVRGTGYAESLATFKQRLGVELPHPAVALGAVDSADARRQIQDLWPDVILDGAIGDLACQVSRHAWAEDFACLRCLFEEAPGEAAEVVASRATGLRPERISTAGATGLVTAEDVEAAPPEMQESLRAHMGRPICSVVSEEIARRSSTTEQPQGFAPSVPFVACLSSAMVVSELVKHLAGWSTALETRYQMDGLTGPAYGQMLPQHRRATCLCATRRSAIDKIRAVRPTRLP